MKYYPVIFRDYFICHEIRITINQPGFFMESKGPRLFLDRGSMFKVTEKLKVAAAQRHTNLEGPTGCGWSELVGFVLLVLSTWRMGSQLVSVVRITPIYISHKKAIWKGSHNPILRGLTITMVINHGN